MCNCFVARLPLVSSSKISKYETDDTDSVVFFIQVHWNIPSRRNDGNNKC